jgi:D-alanyl-lipoteichoic acid acyltransferase DltB (MBOAT superfamily)
VLFTEPTFLFLFLPLLLALYFATGSRARRVRQLAAPDRERHLLREGRRRLHLADAGLDCLQLLDGDCGRSRAYLLLFPQLIAGPIIRYRDIADQLACRTVTAADFACGIRRFVIGLSKKVLIANIVAGPADQIFALPAAQLSPAHAWLGII